MQYNLKSLVVIVPVAVAAVSLLGLFVYRRVSPALGPEGTLALLGFLICPYVAAFVSFTLLDLLIPRSERNGWAFAAGVVLSVILSLGFLLVWFAAAVHVF